MKANRARSESQSYYFSLHNKADIYRKRVNSALTDDSFRNKEGWMQFPLLHPDDVSGLLDAMDAFNKFIDANPPRTSW